MSMLLFHQLPSTCLFLAYANLVQIPNHVCLPSLSIGFFLLSCCHCPFSGLPYSSPMSSLSACPPRHQYPLPLSPQYCLSPYLNSCHNLKCFH
uniref:Uncharacterized protein n=1 Tax=Arundo donax TaxID=35708 RepID=A0A0A9EYJ3_ARUDO